MSIPHRSGTKNRRCKQRGSVHTSHSTPHHTTPPTPHHTTHHATPPTSHHTTHHTPHYTTHHTTPHTTLHHTPHHTTPHHTTHHTTLHTTLHHTPHYSTPHHTPHHTTSHTTPHTTLRVCTYTYTANIHTHSVHTRSHPKVQPTSMSNVRRKKRIPSKDKMTRGAPMAGTATESNVELKYFMFCTSQTLHTEGGTSMEVK